MDQVLFGVMIFEGTKSLLNGFKVFVGGRKVLAGSCVLVTQASGNSVLVLTLLSTIDTPFSAIIL